MKHDMDFERVRRGEGVVLVLWFFVVGIHGKGWDRSEQDRPHPLRKGCLEASSIPEIGTR